MYKKILVIGIVVGAFLVNYGYCEKYTEADMQAVSMGFCNKGTGQIEGYSETMVIEPGKDQKLCLFISNNGPKKMIFDYGFTTAEIIPGGTQMCVGESNTGNIFSMLIPQKNDRVVTIEPNSWQTIYEDVILPPGLSGMQLGCLIFKLVEPESASLAGGMFRLVVRKSRYLNIMIGGETTAKTEVNLINNPGSGGIFSTNKEVRGMIDKDNNLKLSFLMENKGNIPQNINITGRIYNMMGFQQKFSIINQQLNQGLTNEFVVDVGLLPAYKGLFSVEYTIEHTPQFMFPVSNQDLKKPGYITGKASIFIFSRIWVIAIVVVLGILYKVFVPKRKKIISTNTPANIT